MKSEHRLPRRLACVTALAVSLVASVPVSVRGAGNRPDDPARARAATSPAAVTTILGSAWYADNSPIPEPKVRLRSVTTGRIEAEIVGDASGHFTFTNVGGGTYVVELVNDSGRVLTVGHPFVILRGETVATFVRLGSKAPGGSFFANAAVAAIASAAGLGVTALAPTAPPVSAKR